MSCSALISSVNIRSQSAMPFAYFTAPQTKH